MPAIRASIRRHTTGLLIALATMTGPGHGMPAAPATPGTLRVLTLNVAHGRGDALNQLLVSQKAIEGNLAATAALLDGAKAEVVALQEADGPSRWSGGFDHVASLALLAGYPWHARSSHATSWLFDYGTALLSRAPVTEQRSLAFRPTPPSMTKGLTLAQISWRPDDRAEPMPLDVISVHLDFSRDSVRQRQAAEMVAFLSQRRHPVIVLGDFNSDWFAQASVVAELARRCGMKTYRPSADGKIASMAAMMVGALATGSGGNKMLSSVPARIAACKASVSRVRLTPATPPTPVRVKPNPSWMDGKSM
jgi:endonuclease/exonuclease/phosphatase family metal-dependent hydrolase